MHMVGLRSSGGAEGSQGCDLKWHGAIKEGLGVEGTF